ncbi:zinc finger, C2H2-type domain containing protein [Pseudohyphozyma bogoriensis]|nr:zinc finger, C2H2-type domain containing protein [Pseudohyphozyma bogoriensis]
MLLTTQPHASTSTTILTSPIKSPKTTLLINGQLTQTADLPRSGGRVKKFFCNYEGCGKSYTRPTRLEEHVRSHTGEKPFKCPLCDSRFGRDSHLKAHVRTHGSEEDKNYGCDECDKRFWTNQHLKKHVEVVHRGKTYDCTECDEKFRKHNLLRTHVAEVHSTPGTLPFPCPHPLCEKSFKFNFQLKAHSKTHDPTRYMCAHPDCAHKPLEERQFGTWSALQKHSKVDHPPKCKFEGCGKVFTSNRGLRLHLEGVHDSGIGRRWEQEEALNEHVSIRHPALAASSDLSPSPSTSKTASTNLLDLITGRNYAADSSTSTSTRRYRCPFPEILEIGTVMEEEEGGDEEGGEGGDDGKKEEEENEEQVGEQCKWWFKRAYDVERHLRSRHRVAVEREELEEWLDADVLE